MDVCRPILGKQGGRPLALLRVRGNHVCSQVEVTMQRFTLVCAAVCLLWGVPAAEIEVAGFAGLGLPAQPNGRSYRASLYMPLGIQGGYRISDAAFVGAEWEYGGLTFQQNERMTQTFFGGVLQLNLSRDTRGYGAYGRLGGGNYCGKEIFGMAQSNEDSTGLQVVEREIDYSAWGINIGGGVAHRVAPEAAFFGEFVYHVVLDRTDRVSGEERGSTTEPEYGWVVRGGLRFAL
jgi:hypothetical protein